MTDTPAPVAQPLSAALSEALYPYLLALGADGATRTKITEGVTARLVGYWRVSVDDPGMTAMEQGYARTVLGEDYDAARPGLRAAAVPDNAALREALIREFAGSGTYNRTAIWQGIDRALAAAPASPAGLDALREAIHRHRDGCNGRPHRRWYRGENKCDTLAALAAAPASPAGLREAIARLAVGDPEYPLSRVLALAPASPAGLDEYMTSVVLAWREHWESKDHRYGHDFAAFLGERLMTDFNLRAQEPYPFGPAIASPKEASPDA